MTQRIGIYAGTFDPVHPGHVAFALGALQQCALDTVWFLPEAVPRGKQHVTGLDHRTALLEHTLAEHDGLRVQSLESTQFTVANTLPELRKRAGDAELTLLIGSDVVGTLHHWEDVDALLLQVSLAIGMREGDDLAAVTAAMAALEHTHGHQLQSTYVHTPEAAMTSSQIRSGNVDVSYLHPAAQRHIEQYGLYAS